MIHVYICHVFICDEILFHVNFFFGIRELFILRQKSENFIQILNNLLTKAMGVRRKITKVSVCLKVWCTIYLQQCTVLNYNNLVTVYTVARISQ